MRYFPTVWPRKNICADEYTLRVRPRFHVPGVDRDVDDASSCRTTRPSTSCACCGSASATRSTCSTAAAACGARKSCRPARRPRVGRACSSRVPAARELGVHADARRQRAQGRQDGRRRARRGDARRRGDPAGGQRAHRDRAWRPWPGAARVARWQRIAVSSAKQCGRAVVPPIHARDAARAGIGTRRPAAVASVTVRRAGRGARRRAFACNRWRSRPPLHADRRPGGRMDGDGSGRGPRFWRYPDVARRPHAARGCGADRGVDGVAHDLG